MASEGVNRYTLCILVRFEWDPEKELSKHQEARHRLHDGFKVFDDPNSALIKDRIEDETGEQRWHASGRPGSWLQPGLIGT